MILLTKSRQSMSRSVMLQFSELMIYVDIQSWNCKPCFFFKFSSICKICKLVPNCKTWFQLPSLIKTHHNCDWFSWEAHCDGNAPTFDARCFVENLYKRIEILVIRTAEHVSWRNTYSRTYKHMESMNCNICLALHCNCKVETWKHNTPGGTHHKHHQLLSDATLIGCKVIDSHGFSAVTWLELTPTKNSAMPTWAKKTKSHCHLAMLSISLGNSPKNCHRITGSIKNRSEFQSPKAAEVQIAIRSRARKRRPQQRPRALSIPVTRGSRNLSWHDPWGTHPLSFEQAGFNNDWSWKMLVFPRSSEVPRQNEYTV
jgi:hypothetical protein